MSIPSRAASVQHPARTLKHTLHQQTPVSRSPSPNTADLFQHPTKKFLSAWMEYFKRWQMMRITTLCLCVSDKASCPACTGHHILHDEAAGCQTEPKHFWGKCQTGSFQYRHDVQSTTSIDGQLLLAANTQDHYSPARKASLLTFSSEPVYLRTEEHGHVS